MYNDKTMARRGAERWTDLAESSSRVTRRAPSCATSPRLKPTMTINEPPPPRADAQETQRATLAMAKVLRVQRQQGDAAVALIEQASAPASTPGTGRILDVRA